MPAEQPPAITARPGRRTAPEREVLAPDFYAYDWTGLATVELDDRTLALRWPDGAELRAYDLWLRENSVGLSIDATTRECVVDPADLPVDPPAGTAGAVVEATVGSDGALEIRWWDGASSVHHPGWLRHVAEGRHTTGAWLPQHQEWEAADLGGQPPTHVVTSPDRLDETIDAWIDDVVRFGLARLRGVGTELDTVDRIGSTIGALRDTNFGLTWDVKVDVEPNSTANTSHRLAPHTDLPTRETPPGFQFLHCVANTVDGGESTMADGLAVTRAPGRAPPRPPRGPHHPAVGVRQPGARPSTIAGPAPLIDLGVTGPRR